jgi:hypothetical protein
VVVLGLGAIASFNKMRVFGMQSVMKPRCDV